MTPMHGPAVVPPGRGPAPEPSPVRARFDSPDGTAVVSVLVRNAQAIKRSIVQVGAHALRPVRQKLVVARCPGPAFAALGTSS